MLRSLVGSEMCIRDSPAVDVLADGNVLVGDLPYSEFSGFVEVPAAEYVIGIAPTGGDAIAEFTAPLSGLGGGSAVVFASGFLSGDNPAFGLFAALTDGNVLELPVYEEVSEDDCLLDCEGVDPVWFDTDIAEADSDTVYAICNWIMTLPLGAPDGTCLTDCTDDVLSQGNDIQAICDDCLEAQNCEDVEWEDTPSVDSGCDLPSNNLYLTSDGEVFYNSDTDVAGFQFDVDGATVNSAAGGAAAAAGFSVSAGGSTVLGFSFTGAVVPAGCGTLTTLDLSGDAEGLSGLVFSDTSGGAIEFEYYVIALGCTDESACNFDPSADYDDGSCEYPLDNYDCDGTVSYTHLTLPTNREV